VRFVAVEAACGGKSRYSFDLFGVDSKLVVLAFLARYPFISYLISAFGPKSLVLLFPYSMVTILPDMSF
jgi:hypothetical protein